MEKLNIIVGVALLGCGIAVSGISTPETSSDPWFQRTVLESQRPVVVKFGAEWCGPCRSMDAAMDQLQGRFPQATFLKVDVDEKPDLFSEFRSGQGIPQVVLFRNGSVASRQRGFGGEQQFANWLQRNL